VQKLNRQTNERTQAIASAKSKVVQRHPKANAQLHHIFFCPKRTTILNRK
jgi:hypothetical protein